MSLLTLNGGSSSLKACWFDAAGGRHIFNYPAIGQGGAATHAEAIAQLFEDLNRTVGNTVPVAVSHRIVHGGACTVPALRITPTERARLDTLVPLAPLHLPHNLLALDAAMQRFAVPHIACFDTAFHHTLPEQAYTYPLPAHLLSAHHRRYGFHGLNYRYIATQLPRHLGEQAQGRILVLHLGSGASLCLLNQGQSVDTTMGFTPAGGILMGTRPGDLDPGLLLDLIATHGLTTVAHAVYFQAGLAALSGHSGNMQTLLADAPHDPHARFAIEAFCRSIQGAIGSLAAKAGGIDALVFTGGIGEHAADIRQAIIAPLAFMGFSLDPQPNAQHATRLHHPTSKPILLLPADEESSLRDLALACL